jgi:glycosyltransferase involved in cell wall biosynthesis
MRIAQIAPIIERVPPKKYGGTERVVSCLTEELVRRGHEVTLFASGDSVTKAKLRSVYPRALREARFRDLYGTNSKTLLNIGLAYASQDEFDIIHDHSGYISQPTANLAKTPVVLTMHGQFAADLRDIYKLLPRPHIVTISKEQGKYASDLNIVGTVYNGLEMDDYPFSTGNDGYLLFVGRLSMEKGPHYAIEVALAMNLPLILAAKLEEVDRPYFRQYVEPYLSEQIRWIGEVDERERNRLMSRAMCFLHPITWREPFGLTLIEAMACGCPVIAFGLGSIPELIVNGRTGFVVSTVVEMIDAVGRIAQIDRHRCRQHALRNFNAKKMTDGYEAIYRHILSQDKK